MRLQVSQSPRGGTRHRVFAIMSDCTSHLIANLAGCTEDGQWLEVEPDAPLENVRSLRVEALESPSWVAWREVQVFGTPSE